MIWIKYTFKWKYCEFGDYQGEKETWIYFKCNRFEVHANQQESIQCSGEKKACYKIDNSMNITNILSLSRIILPNTYRYEEVFFMRFMSWQDTGAAYTLSMSIDQHFTIFRCFIFFFFSFLVWLHIWAINVLCYNCACSDIRRTDYGNYNS